MNVLFDVMTLVHAVDNHTFGNRDDLWRNFVQNTYNGTVIAIIGVWVGHKREQFVSKLLLIGKEFEYVRHEL